MRQLILMRHGKAETASGHGDHARPLSARGRAEAAGAGRRLAALARPDLALASDSLRTRETLDSVSGAFAAALPRRLSRGLYAVTSDALLDEVRATPDAVASLLVIGHNPGIGDLARHLTGTAGKHHLDALTEGFPTSCFAVLEFDRCSWSGVAAPGRLAFLFPADERSGA